MSVTLRRRTVRHTDVHATCSACSCPRRYVVHKRSFREIGGHEFEPIGPLADGQPPEAFGRVGDSTPPQYTVLETP